MTQLLKNNRPVNVFSFYRKPLNKVIKTKEQIKEENCIEKDALKGLININMKTIRKEKARQARKLKKLIKSQPSYEINEEEAINDIINIGEQLVISYKTSNETNENTPQKIIVDNVMKQLKAKPSNLVLDIDIIDKEVKQHNKSLLLSSISSILYQNNW